MDGDPIPVHVRRLLDRRFGSVSEVEVVVVLVRRPRPWTVREVAREFVLGVLRGRVRQLLSGVLAALSIVAALGFRRFAKRSQDRFFLFFSAAFVLLGLNSVALGLAE